MVAAVAGVTLVSVQRCTAKADDRFAIRVTLETLDDALTAARQFVEVRDARELSGLLREMAPVARRRAAFLGRVEAEDGIALVDRLVEAAVVHTGTTAGAVIADLRSTRSDVVTLHRPGTPVVKAWLCDGRLRCSFDIDRELRWTSRLLILRSPLFETMQSALAGERLGRIADHPMLPAATRIASCNSVDGEHELRLRLPARVVRRAELD